MTTAEKNGLSFTSVYDVNLDITVIYLFYLLEYTLVIFPPGKFHLYKFAFLSHLWNIVERVHYTVYGTLRHLLFGVIHYHNFLLGM